MLTVTNFDVRFQPHIFNLSRNAFVIGRDDILSVEKFDSLGIFPNGIVIKVRSGATFKFVVARRDHVLQMLNP